MANDKINLIIIDDCHDFCVSLKFMLDLTSDFNATLYQNGFDFLNKWSSHSPGFVLMDLLMPGISGIELLEELAKVPHQFYIITMSGHADKFIAKKVKDLGAHEFLPKPFDIHTLLENLRKINAIRFCL